MPEGIAIGQAGKPKLCIGWLPGRKRPSLYFWDPLGIRTLASFKDDGAAEDAIRFIESMARAKVVFVTGEE